MTGDQYVAQVLANYAVNRAVAQAAAERVAPAIRSWAGTALADLSYSGSFAKGTGNGLSTDIDLFISLRSEAERDIPFMKENSWRAILELRRAQLEAWKAAQGGEHPALFELRSDSRPAAERTAAGRYQEPSLLSHLQERQH